MGKLNELHFIGTMGYHISIKSFVEEYQIIC